LLRETLCEFLWGDVHQVLGRFNDDIRGAIPGLPQGKSERLSHSAVNLVLRSHLTDGEKGCAMLSASARLCTDWEAWSPWDAERVAPVRAFIEARRQGLHCPQF
jgi:hypothetical protein